MRVHMLKDYTESHTEQGQSLTLQYPAGSGQFFPDDVAAQLIADGIAERALDSKRVVMLANLTEPEIVAVVNEARRAANEDAALKVAGSEQRHQKGESWVFDEETADALVAAGKAKDDTHPDYDPATATRNAAIAQAKALAPAPETEGTAAVEHTESGAAHEEG